jgi:hypothetical protein
MDNQKQDFSLTVDELKSLTQEISNELKPTLHFSNTLNDELIYASLLSLFNEEKLKEYKYFFQQEENNFISEKIAENQKLIEGFNSKTILLAYFLCTVKYRGLPNSWPIELTILQRVYSHMGISPSWAVV